ncbi:alpha-keto acid decarboxylase family protein [Sporolactobacillus sp. STSJ-5]|uniref:alpha-keto acid decarboxylase family protein n=1 Tax=Sporolactobacillus sp. STSJ-5 TaxID=2965076 RepID=UPI0021069A77|nr:alpha-keto acid decarboxylase family protein [Sporolactobacillus sp. STSJ-5]MCQ2010417.1 alpha-keto acid decarboxylase family protein [Sporolactobacillus sp. STSJ-5]
MSTTYTIGRYLVDRLGELGIRHIFGVPGDYNLSFLDTIIEHPALDWVGNCNELNAAYAADGYARIHGISALVTTFGVGELSAVNGIAGSRAEQVPVVKITGSPASKIAEEGRLVHHTLGDGEFNHFSKMYKEVTAAQTTLTAKNATEEIDRVLRVCWYEKAPVYINLPVDIHALPAEQPKEPLLKEEPAASAHTISEMLETLVPVIEKAKSPVILADYQVSRFHAQEALKKFVEATGFPIATLSMGKGVFNEEHPQFIGVYSGKTSPDYLRNRIDHADCILSIGVKFTDSITGGFSQGFNENVVIHISPKNVNYLNRTFSKIPMDESLNQLAGILKKHDFPDLNIIPVTKQQRVEPFYVEENQALTQKRFWEMIRLFIQKDDVVVADQGTSFFGAQTVPLKENVTYIGQPLWGSIGYTLPATLGTQLADLSRRNLLLIGDGAFQLTFQEISTMLRENLHPIIFVINNDGYTVERSIHGPEAPYNDIKMWRYADIPAVLGGNKNFKSYKTNTEGELADALKDIAESPDVLRFVEVVTQKMDMPELLTTLGKVFAAQND